MRNKPIIIISGEPYSVFLEIFFKVYKTKFLINYKKPIILVGSKKLVELQMKKLGFFFKINLIKRNQITKIKNNNSKINLIDVNLDIKKPFGKITSKFSKYIDDCFNIGIDLMKKKEGFALINGPISKKHFLKKKFNGVTEYLANKTKKKDNEVMLIYNKYLSVCPITTHIPLKSVHRNISVKKIIYKIKIINKFYKEKFKINPRFAVTGLNPHCESNFNTSEEKKIIIPAIKILKKYIDISGPYATDTLFIKENIKKFDVIIGMYHDQVLTPLKTIFGFNAINLTLGLPFIRVSPDHGPNSKMLGQNKSNPASLKDSLIFLNNINEN